jgi:hypothetical protein
MKKQKLSSDLVGTTPVVRISVEKVVLDVENPRIQFLIDSYLTKGIKLNDITQKQLMLGLKVKTKAKFDSLKESIETKGLLEPIWVIQHNDKYTVIEGNTRRLIFEDLSRKYPDKNQWKEINAHVLPSTTPKETVAFLRLEYHLGGKQAWDPYERARYLYNLSEDGYTTERLAREARSSETEIKNDIKAFEVMRDNFLPKYGTEVDNPLEKYSYFVELVGKQKVRNLLRSGQFTIDDYCEWVADEKIPRAIDVRDLPEIFSHEDIARTFKEKGYDEAMEVLATIKPDAVSPLFRDIDKVTDQLLQLRSYEIIQIREEEPAKKKKIESLIKVAQSVLK